MSVERIDMNPEGPFFGDRIQSTVNELMQIAADPTILDNGQFLGQLQSHLQALREVAAQHSSSSLTARLVENWFTDAKVNVRGADVPLDEALQKISSLQSFFSEFQQEGSVGPFLASVQQFLFMPNLTPASPAQVALVELKQYSENPSLSGSRAFLGVLQQSLERLSADSLNQSKTSVTATVTSEWLNHADLEVDGTRVTLEAALQKNDPQALNAFLQAFMKEGRGETFTQFLNALHRYATQPHLAAPSSVAIAQIEMKRIKSVPGLIDSPMYMNLLTYQLNQVWSDLSGSNSGAAQKLVATLSQLKEADLTFPQALDNPQDMQKYLGGLLDDAKNYDRVMKDFQKHRLENIGSFTMISQNDLNGLAAPHALDISDACMPPESATTYCGVTVPCQPTSPCDGC